MESSSLTYSCMVVSYFGYLESSVNNQLFIKETSNTNKKTYQNKIAKKRAKQNRLLRQILNGIDKENNAVFEESTTEVNIKQIYNYKLSNYSNNPDLYAEIYRSYMKQKGNFDDVT